MLYYKITRQSIFPMIDTRIKPLKDQVQDGDVFSTDPSPDGIEHMMYQIKDGICECIGWEPTLLPHTPQYEGISHINMYSQSKLEVGRVLSNFYRYEGVAVVNGHEVCYNTIEGLWQYLKTGNIELLFMEGREAKNAAKKMKVLPPVNRKVDHEQFHDIIFTAMKRKIAGHPYHLQFLKNNPLPIVHYYVCLGSNKAIQYKDDCVGLAILNEVIQDIKGNYHEKND
ncbi:hypothetical protein [Vibrio phage VP-1]|uniref:Uncharacterized protein n=1 Tax=Vibrio phage VP-1 TaxID=2234088 RepID=A0A4P2TH77_9CAUD|nr:hypothetical protein [Vibrio phage VP-1]